MRRPIYAIASVILALSSCGSEEPAPVGDIYTGVWAGNAGEDTFIFQFSESDSDVPGIIHCLRDGKKYSEMPMTTVTWNPPVVEAYMSATDITYSGELQGEVITGRIGDLPMNLEITEASSVPGLLPVNGVYSYSVPGTLADGFSSDEFPAVTAEALVNRISSGDAGIVHSILVWSEGKLVFEEYFHGYTVDDLHRTMSVSKSISSLLVGIALDQEAITSVSVPMNSFFEDFPEEANLEHLLTMSLGLGWTDQEAEMIHDTGEQFFTSISRKELTGVPGEQFRYVNADVNLLSGILHQATGQYPDQFAEEHLFEPLGISEYDWSYGETGGHRLMDGSLHLRPRDMLKIGVMVLQNGEWNGETIVSSEWITASAEPMLHADELFDYGYLWWLTSIPQDGCEMKVILASGWGSQFIAVIPEADIVIVTTGGNDDNGMNWKVLLLITEILFDHELL